MSAVSKRRQKSPAVVGIGNAASPQGVEIRLVAAQQFQVLQTRSSGQQVVGDVEHVIGVVVGQMDLQQPEALVDRLDRVRACGPSRWMAPMPPWAVARVRSAIS